MTTQFKTVIWRQFGAAIDMLENAIVACPANVWGDRPGWHEFWYLASHTLFFMDYYMSDSAEGFAPPSPFGLEGLDPAGVLPSRVYTKDELLAYLAHCRVKTRKAIGSLTDDRAYRDAGSIRPGLTVVELYLYTMRHVQHHAAQLNLILRQKTDSAAPRWVSITKIDL
jgi:hypothetical protein